MGTFKLSLPTDIPWRRLCVSADMLDPTTCDDARPPRWHSSLAAFRYDPDEQYQPFQEEVISYLKVVATIAPFQQTELGLADLQHYVPPQLIGKVDQSYPCYGAVLQVSVAPPREQQDSSKLLHYPYFIDFEPKKRELYEAVTDTGEVLSGSLSNLSVGKAASDTYSAEDYNLDMGGGGGGSLFWGLASVNGTAQQQMGTVTRNTQEVQNTRSTDFSTERRELQSHSTQLSQMYNLFQAFHLGTNRAVFLIEPRPHVRQTAATFINGPRAIEGIQEVFLVVVRPKTMSDFCVDALLETAHVTVDEKSQAITDTKQRQLIAQGSSSYTDGSKQSPAGSSKTAIGEGGYGKVDFTPDPGWEIDLSTNGGFSPIVTKNHGVTKGPTYECTADHFLATCNVNKTGDFEADITIYVRATEMEFEYGISHLFLSGRELCCCPPSPPKATGAHEKETGAHAAVSSAQDTAAHTAKRTAPQAWVSFEKDLRDRRWHYAAGPMSHQTFLRDRRLAATIRDEMIRSFSSPLRYARGAVRFSESDAFHSHLADLLSRSDSQARLAVPLSTLTEVNPQTRERLAQALGQQATAETLLRADGAVLAQILDRDVAAVGQLKSAVLRRIGA